MTPAPIRRRRGRPCLDSAGSTSVSVRLGNTTYDELYAVAKARGLEVAVLIRQAIQQQLVTDRRQASR